MIVFTVLTERVFDDRNYLPWRTHRRLRLNDARRRFGATLDALDWLMDHEISHCLLWGTSPPGEHHRSFHAQVGFPCARDAVLFRLMFPQFPVAEEAA